MGAAKFRISVITHSLFISFVGLGFNASAQDLDGAGEPASVINGTAIEAGSSTATRVVNDGTYLNAAGAGGSQDILLDASPFVGNVTNFDLTVNGMGLDYVYGGLTDQGNVENNRVTVSGGAQVGINAYGAYSAEGNATNNTIIVAGTVDGNVNGAHIKTTGDVIGNRVTITSTGTTNDSIYGGSTKTGQATGNVITIAGTVNGDADGAYIDVQGDAVNNAVTVEQSGLVANNVYGAVTSDGAINNNLVTIDGTVQSDVYGAYTVNGNSAGNGVTVNGTVQNDVYGGYSYQGVVDSSSVSVAGSVANDVYGGYSIDGNVTNNSVAVSGSAGNDIYGGYSWNGDASANRVTVTGSAGNNTTGGYTASGNAINNTVNIEQSAALSSSSQLLGGSGTGDIFSGNTLNLNGWSGTVDQLQNFEHYNITLPAAFAVNDTVITVAGATATMLDNPNNPGQKATFSVSNAAGILVKAGDKFTVISNTAMSDGSVYQFENQGLQGVSVQYDYLLANAGDGTPLEFTVLQTRLNPQTKSLQQGRNASATFLTLAADFAVNQGLNAAFNAPLRPLTDDGWGLGVFVTGAGSSVRQKTGSHVDVSGANFMTGLSVGNRSAATPTTLSMFFEAGSGNYDGHSGFSGGSEMTGRGDLSYRGGGVMAKVENIFGGLYLEGSFRLGRYKSNFSSDNFYVPGYLGGRLPKFDLNGDYHSAHGGVGYVFDLGHAVKFDTAVKYLWSRLDGDTVNLLGDNFHFDTMNSHRVQAGGRLLWQTSDNLVSPYVGAWYEYEFDGKSNAEVQGFALPETRLKGTSGIMETGVKLRARHSPLEANFGINGSVGRREGIGGFATLYYTF